MCSYSYRSHFKKFVISRKNEIGCNNKKGEKLGYDDDNTMKNNSDQ